jgi:hypothetical protein
MHGKDPKRVEGENFLMYRDNMEFELKVKGMGKLTGKGKVIVTTLRLILVNCDSKKSELVAFDIPHGLTFAEKFNQPIFGANYWYCKCKPLHNSLPGEVECKLWFMQGGCEKFLCSIRHCLKILR